MARLPLHTLPAFQAVARRGNMRAAAEDLHLTHSAISQQIKLLESQLGLSLFDRHGRRLMLNAAGHALWRAVDPALDGLAAGVRAAQAAATGIAQHLRLTVLPSLAQRWLLPRIGRWRERHPDITIEVHTAQVVADLVREGFHAGLRAGNGQWRGLDAEALDDSPLIAVAAPQRAARLRQGDAVALAAEPLLGDSTLWKTFLALDGQSPAGRPIADFNDAGLMLQAAEQDLGIALARKLLVADALQAGRLVRVAPRELPEAADRRYWIAFPPDLADWAPLNAFRGWLHEERTRSRAAAGDDS